MLSSHDDLDHARAIVRNDADNAVASEPLVFRVPSVHQFYDGLQTSNRMKTRPVSSLLIPTMLSSIGITVRCSATPSLPRPS